MADRLKLINIQKNRILNTENRPSSIKKLYSIENVQNSGNNLFVYFVHQTTINSEVSEMERKL